MPVFDLPDIAEDPWSLAVWREFRAGHLQLSHLRVLVALHRLCTEQANASPTYDRLAQRAGCGSGAARLALHRARALGLVSWQLRHRGSSLYRLHLPAGDCR